MIIFQREQSYEKIAVESFPKLATATKHIYHVSCTPFTTCKDNKKNAKNFFAKALSAKQIRYHPIIFSYD
jgi:hypothetical protein